MSGQGFVYYIENLKKGIVKMKPCKTLNVGMVFVLVCLLFGVGFAEKPFLEAGRKLPASMTEYGLAGLEKVYVLVECKDIETVPGKLNLSTLQKTLERKLKMFKVNVVSAEEAAKQPDAVEEYRVAVELLTLPNANNCIFRVQSFLSRGVSVGIPGLRIKADVWKSPAVMKLVSVKQLSDKVMNTSLNQSQAFIMAHRLTNMQMKSKAKAIKAKAKSTSLTRENKPTQKVEAIKHKYVASKNGDVFHKPDCASAKRIKAANLVGYNSRKEAIKAGKRPCKRCKP